MRRIALFVAMALLTAACGGSAADSTATVTDGTPTKAPASENTQPPATGQPLSDVPSLDAVSEIEACSLLAPDEISAEVGNEIFAGEQQGNHLCNWDSPDLSDVSVVLTAPLGVLSPEDDCQGQRDLRRPEAVDIAGLGFEAWWWAGGEGVFSNGDLTVCTDRGVFLLVVAGERDHQTLRTNAENLMRLALGRP